jgi:hypothetical protein
MTQLCYLLWHDIKAGLGNRGKIGREMEEDGEDKVDSKAYEYNPECCKVIL